MQMRPISSRSNTTDERQAKPTRPRRIARWLTLGIASALLAPAFPAAASAADYCVAPNTSCGGTNVQTFEQALDLADNATDADRIFLGAATYTAPSASGYVYNKAGSPVEIIGQGEGHTILTSPIGGNTAVLRLFGGAGTSVHDLTIRLPQNAAAGLNGLWTQDTAQRIQVVEDPTQANQRRGVVLEGGTLEDSTVTLGTTHSTLAVLLDTGGGTVRGSSLSAQIGVYSGGGGTIERSGVTGSAIAVDAYRYLTTITSSVVRVTEGGGGNTAISLETQTGVNTTVHADGVTIIGPALPDTFGAYVSTSVFPDQNASLTLTNSIIRDVSTPLRADAAGSGQSSIAASYSDYDPSANATNGPNAIITQANISNVGDARFVDATGGDYHLLPASPLVDSGDPAAAQALDFDGNPLVADGNGDGIARRDMGAFELQPAAGGGQPGGAGQLAGGSEQGRQLPADTQPPLVSDFRAGPSRFAVAGTTPQVAANIPRGTRFRYTLSEPARVTLTIQRALAGRRQHGKCVRPTPQLRRAVRCTRDRNIVTLTKSAQAGANSTRFTGKLDKRALPPGSYRAIIIATDAAGNRSAPRRARFRIIPA
jgi:hypothetical protein